MSKKSDISNYNWLPERIGKYKIKGVLGMGGMGIIYRAVQEPLDRIVALKVLSPSNIHNEESSKRFEIEARAISLLEHQNIVSIYEYGESDGYRFFAMQYVDGIDLAKRIAEKKPMSFNEIVDIAKQMCRGLRYAHSKNVVHRDIKPQNVLIDKTGVARLSDFGIAKIFSQSALTITGMAVGTPEYMSPEQAEGRELDAQTDIYSLGIVMYEMITKKPPFLGENPVSVAYKQVHEPPIPPSVKRRDVPKRLELIVLKAMKKNAAERYHTIDDMLEHLDSVDVNEKGESPTVVFSIPKTPGPQRQLADQRITDRRSGERRYNAKRYAKPLTLAFWRRVLETQGIALAFALGAILMLLLHILAHPR